MNFERIAWMGSLVIVASFLPALSFLMTPVSAQIPLSSRAVRQEIAPEPAEIDLPLCSDFRELSVGASQDQIAFSIDSARPDVTGLPTAGDVAPLPTGFLVRLLGSKQMKRIEMKSQEKSGFVRIGLAYDSNGVLQFSEDASAFWLECRLLPDHRINAAIFYRTPAGEVVGQAEWIPVLMQTPLQTAEEFPQESPFRELAMSKWWGADLLAQRIRGGELLHRLEVGQAANSKVIDCQVGDWLVFNGKSWEKYVSREGEDVSNGPLARIQTANPQFIEIEGWQGAFHLRFRLNLITAAPLKIKTEELFTQLRVRSEKQVSCTLDKQCLVLRPGDWVVKMGGRWKTLRKLEEKEALLMGETAGEVFVLEKIGVAPSGRNIVGYYYSAGRTQVIPVELAQRTQKGRRPSR